MEEEIKEVEQAEVEQTEVEASKEEVKEKVYEVKTKEFVNDYVETLKQKEIDLNKGMEELDRRVNEKLEALRPEIVEEVKKEIVKEIDEQYAGRIELYEKYLVEVEPVKEEQVEENVGGEQAQIVEGSEAPAEGKNVENGKVAEEGFNQPLDIPNV